MAAENNLAGFISKLKSSSGLSLASQYIVTIADPYANDITILVDSVSVPGVNLMTQEVRTFGEIVMTPYGVLYSPISMSVLLDNTGNQLRYFHDWSNSVVDRHTRFVHYKRDYAKTVTIAMLTRNGDVVYKIELEDAWPIAVSDIQLDYSNTGTNKINIQLQYSRWTLSGVDVINTEKLRINPASDDFYDSVGESQPLSMQSEYDAYIKSGARDFGNIGDFSKQLSSYGSELGSSVGRTCSSMQNVLRTNPFSINGVDKTSEFSQSLGQLTSNFVSFGQTVSDLGRNLTAVTSPMQAMAGATSAISGTLGSVDTTLSALGLGSPFSKIRSQLNNTSGLMYNVSQLKGVPLNLSTIGANVSGIGKTFGDVSRSVNTAGNAAPKLLESFSKLSSVFTREGMNVSNASSGVDKYANWLE